LSYSISLSGHGPDPDDVREIFENTVRALRAVTPEGASPPGGSCSVGGENGLTHAADVSDTSDLADDGEAGDETQPDPEETE
jgi:hypothetical protein